MRPLQGRTMRDQAAASLAIEPLLRAGIAPGHARRLVAEWRAHFEDSKRAAMASGLSDDAAAQHAWAALGEPAQLIAAAAAQPALRSRVHRHAAVIFVLGTPLVFAVGFAGTLAFAVVASPLMGGTDRSVAGATLAHWLGEGGALRAFLLWWLPALTSCVAGLWADRHRVRTTWPLIGAAIIALVGASTNVGVQRGADGAPKALEAGMGVSTDALGPMALRITVTLALAGLCFRWLARRNQHSAH